MTGYSSLSGFRSRIVLLLTLVKPTFPFEVTCQNDGDCVNQLRRETSTCVEGRCTNPFHSGCLRSLAMENNNERFMSDAFIRECNSDDDPESALCSHSFFGYDEVRISVGNWESAILYSWIIQILLSEVLSVPVTIDTNGKGQSSFYDIDGGFSYADIAYNFEALKEADRVGGKCDHAIENGETNSCAHILPEVWVGTSDSVKRGQDEGYLLPEDTNGMVGKLGLFVPLHTAKRDWSLTSFHGLRDNRTKVAERFGRPTSWLEYCTNITNVNCTEGNDIAKRQPMTEIEKNSYFVEGEFIGHFQKDDCVTNPTTCTGYFVNAPCHWSTFSEAQMFWNNISLKSDGPEKPNSGYSYSQMIQILYASNATKEDLMLWWFSPDMTYQKFPLQRVHLPKPSQSCLQSRPPDKCSENETERLGNFLGSCDYAEHPLSKIISKGLQTSTFEKSEVDRSPALEFLRQIRIPTMSMDEILRDWVTTSSDSFTARDVVCRWVDDNIDYLYRYLPSSYPRAVIKDGLYSIFLLRFGLSFAVLAVLITVIAAIFTVQHKKHRVLIYSHVNFLYINLMGFLLVSIAAILYTFEPTNATCLLKEWTVTIGYTLQFVPLLLKIAAINKITQQSLSLRRVDFKLDNLKIGVLSVLFCVIAYLTVWSIVDPSSKVEHRVLGSNNQVNLSLYCTSRSNAWKFLAFTWEVVLLLCILVLALQSTTLIKELDESQSLPLMVYTHFLFLVVRLIIAALGFTNAITANLEGGITSLLLSGDTILCILIYFGEKFRAIHYQKNSKNRNSSSSSFQKGSLRYSDSFFRASAISALRESTRHNTLINKNKEKYLDDRNSFVKTRDEFERGIQERGGTDFCEEIVITKEESDLLPSNPCDNSNGIICEEEKEEIK